jgi:hypothetical protein
MLGAIFLLPALAAFVVRAPERAGGAATAPA